MDELERALRAVLSDPGQMEQLRSLAGSLGLSPPEEAPQIAEAPAEKPSAPVFTAQPPSPPEPAAALLRQAGRMDKRQENLLLAIKPFLRKDRQEKVERALHAARLASLASLALKSRQEPPGAKERP